MSETDTQTIQIGAIRHREVIAMGQAACLGDLETLAMNERMLSEALIKLERYHEAAFWASAYADATERLVEAHDGDPARREIICHGDWIEQRRVNMKLAIRKDEARKPGTETATIRNCRADIFRRAQ